MNMEFLFDEPFPLFDEIIWKEEDEFSYEQFSEVKENWSSLSPSLISGENQQKLTVPKEGREIENGVSLKHLATAYGEAVEMKQTQHAEVIKRRITDKVSVFGEIKERVLYYAFSQFSDYLRKESVKKFGRALQAFYQIFPYGMIPHSVANSVILDSMPCDAEILHVLDFDIGEGVQWPSLIFAISQQKRKITLRLTVIKWREEERKLEETKRRLQDYAGSLGIMLISDEKELQDLWMEMKRVRKRGGKQEWLAFNCMWALPHMGRRRSKRQVMGFVGVAKELLAIFRAIVTFSDGGERLNNYNNGFGSFFGSYMQHYQTLLEAIEWNFPVRLAEARLAMECLFVAPRVSCHTIIETWEEFKEGNDEFNLKTGFGFEGLSLRNESLIEAKEMAREGVTPFGIRIEGDNNNEMVLEWKRIPLLRVSAWR